MDNSELEHLNIILNEEAEIRERIKEQVNELDKKSRTIVGTLNRIHTTPMKSMPGLVISVQPLVQECRTVVAALAKLVTPNQFWRFKDMWTNSLRNVVFAIVLAQFLENHTLASISSVGETLALQKDWESRFTISVEDYLHALISVVNELSRLAVNFVTMGDYDEPLKISHFVKDIFAGFSMLNLKNDILRRRYDSLKYDIKKIEEARQSCMTYLSGDCPKVLREAKAS